MSNESKPKTKEKVTLEERWGAVPSGMGRLLPHDLFAVYVVMTTYVNNKTRQCYPSKELLAYATGTTERTIEKAWAQLESVGAIVRVREGFVKGGIRRAAVFECQGPKDVLKKLCISEEVLKTVKPQDVSWFVRKVNPDDTDRVSKRPPSGQAMPKKRRKEIYYVDELEAVAEAQAATSAKAETEAPETEVPHLNDQVPHLNDEVPHLNDSMPHLNDEVPHLNETPNTLVTPKGQRSNSSITSYRDQKTKDQVEEDINYDNFTPDLSRDVEDNYFNGTSTQATTHTPPNSANGGRVDRVDADGVDRSDADGVDEGVVQLLKGFQLAPADEVDSEVVQLLKGFHIPRLTPEEASSLWVDGVCLIRLPPEVAVDYGAKVLLSDDFIAYVGAEAVEAMRKTGHLDADYEDVAARFAEGYDLMCVGIDIHQAKETV